MVQVVIPLCGGNIDTTVLGRCMERGLAADGRLVRFVAAISDRPGGIANLMSELAQAGASVKDVFHERAWLDSDIFSVQVCHPMHCMCVCMRRHYLDRRKEEQLPHPL